MPIYRDRNGYAMYTDRNASQTTGICDGKKCSSRRGTGVMCRATGYSSRGVDLTCTLTHGHNGNHIACSSSKHNLHNWEQKEKKIKKQIRWSNGR